MPQIDVTRMELESLIQCVVECRLHATIESESCMFMNTEDLPDLHLKLENALELWINGGTVELPIPEQFKKLGVSKWEKEYPPHDEGIKND